MMHSFLLILEVGINGAGEVISMDPTFAFCNNSYLKVYLSNNENELVLYCVYTVRLRKLKFLHFNIRGVYA